MITTAATAKVNLIIEAASNMITQVIKAMVADPLDPSYRGDWLARYQAIKDLNVLTAIGDDHLAVTAEYPDRYPYCIFFIDQVIPNPESSSEEHFIGSLGCSVTVIGTTFAIAQRELHEIQHQVRSIMVLDKSLGEIAQIGGVIDTLKFSHWAEPELSTNEMRKYILSVDYFYKVYFRERVYR